MTDDNPPPDFRPATDKPKVKRPWIIECRWVKAHCNPLRLWHVFDRYATEKQRDQALNDLISKPKHYGVKPEYRKGNADVS